MVVWRLSSAFSGVNVEVGIVGPVTVVDPSFVLDDGGNDDDDADDDDGDADADKRQAGCEEDNDDRETEDVTRVSSAFFPSLLGNPPLPPSTPPLHCGLEQTKIET